MCLPEMLNEGKTHSGCGCHHSIVQDPKLKEEEKMNRRPSLGFPEHTVNSHLLLLLHSSLPRWTVALRAMSLPLVALVGYSVTAIRRVSVTIGFNINLAEIRTT